MPKKLTDTKPEGLHPMQPLVVINGVVRFRENAIVRHLLDDGPFDLNTIHIKDFSNEDRMQFAQLIAYSVSGYGGLSYVSTESVYEADYAASKLRIEQKEKP